MEKQKTSLQGKRAIYDSLCFRKASADELPAICALHQECFPDYADKRPIEQIITERLASTYVLLVNSEFAGFFNLIYMDEPRIASLCLKTQFRNYGFGKYLIAQAEETVISQGFKALNAKTSQYRELYVALQYKTITSYLQGGKEHFLMRKAL